MSLVIRSNTAVENISLKIEETGVAYSSGAIFTSARRFRFAEIACILLSEDGCTLSFQVGEEVFKLRVKPGNKDHDQVIAAFTQGVTGTPQ